MSNELVRVPFHGGEILLHGDQIIVKTVCDVLTLATHGQAERIRRDERLATWARKIRVQLPTDEQSREYLTIPRKKLAAFLYGIQPGMVKDKEIRANLIKLQDELEDVMDAYFAARVGGASADELLGKLREMSTAMEEQIRGAARLAGRVGDLETQLRAVTSGAIGDVERIHAWALGMIRDIATLRTFATDMTNAQARGAVQEDLRRALRYWNLPWEEFPYSRLDELRHWLRWLERDAMKAARRKGFEGEGAWTQPPLPFAGLLPDSDDDGEVLP